jgi:carbon-monoxide dehydrogenase medium subunit
MRPFEYYDPQTVEEVCSLLAKHREEAKVIAGGQSLLILLKQRLFSPKYLINLKNISALDYIQHNGKGGLRIGAITSHRSLETSTIIRERFPVLSEAEQLIGSVQIRNMGTVGGSLCHADPAADLAPVLIVLEAMVKVVSSKGVRTIPLREFFISYYETVLTPEEILTEVIVPNPPPNSGSAYQKFIIRAGDMAIVSSAASISINPKTEKCTGVRIALGAAGSTPLRIEKAEDVLKGNKIDESSIGEAARIASQEAHPVGDIHASEEYKRELIRVLTRDVLRSALERARS